MVWGNMGGAGAVGHRPLTWSAPIVLANGVVGFPVARPQNLQGFGVGHEQVAGMEAPLHPYLVSFIRDILGLFDSNLGKGRVREPPLQDGKLSSVGLDRATGLVSIQDNSLTFSRAIVQSTAGSSPLGLLII